jgi:PAS domain S-box-containing protein
MRSAVWLADLISHILIIITALSAANAVVRRRDAHRLNILAFVFSVAFEPLVHHPGQPVEWAIGEGLLLLQPYLLLRLARHFQEVPRLLLGGAIAIALVGALVIKPHSREWIIFYGTPAYMTATFTYLAVAFSRQASQTGGVTARRLAAAAVGTWAYAYAWAIGTTHSGWTYAYPSVQVADCVMYCAYFLAFATPRRLRAGWQRTEQAKYLSATADRDTEDRGRRAATDVLEAARRSVGHSLVLVALRQGTEAAKFVVRAATDRPFVGTTLNPTGVIGRVVASGVAELAPTSDNDADLVARIGAEGTRVLVAPIGTSAHLWGLTVVTQRRGALFPDDDLVLLAQFGRYAATALDHAALVAEARERERRRADIRLQAAEVRTRLMLDSITDYAMFVVDPEGLVVTWHAGAEHVFDYVADEMTGESSAPLYLVPLEQFQGRLHEALQLGRAVWEGPCQRKNGQRFLGTTVVRPLAGNADLMAFVVVTRDVTEQRHLEDQLRQSQKMEAIGQLAGGIAHDFNNMLLAILGNADLLALGAADSPSQMEHIVEIQRAVERAEGLTRRLLAFGRRQNLQPTAISLSSLVTDLLPMLRRVIAENIELEPNTSGETRPVLGDSSQLEQVIVNLTVNARDAMPYGGRLSIRTGTEWLDDGATGGEVPAGAYAVLDVADTGVGMDAATQEHIFEPFFTTKGYGQGTGLGLATVYGIVKQMGGLIRVSSEPGQGTTFRIYLPETRERAIVTAPAAVMAPPGGHETLLLVEDDTAVRNFLVRTLERHGYKVIPADHPTTALSIVEAGTDAIDLVITDVVLPGLVGPEFVRALAALRGDLPALPVLYISGYASSSPVWQGEVPKASHFLQKPFSARELLTRIRQILPPPGGAQGHAV